MELSIQISQEVINRFPTISMGYFLVSNIDNNVDSEMLNQAIQDKLIKLDGLYDIDEIPGVKKWRQIFLEMNCKKGKISSIESLMSIYLDNRKLPAINSIVDYYNALSCFLGTPMGAYTVDAMPEKKIQLREAKKGEEFIPIGGKTLEKTSNGEIIYSDGGIVICKLWNNKDCDLTKITELSQNVLFIFDGADGEQKIKIKEGIEIMKVEIPSIFKAKSIASGILDSENLQISIC